MNTLLEAFKYFLVAAVVALLMTGIALNFLKAGFPGIIAAIIGLVCGAGLMSLYCMMSDLKDDE